MASEPRVCPRCGSPVAASQEICIECGEQLGGRRLPGGWVVPAAAALAVAAMSATVVIAIGKDDGTPPVVAPPLTSVATTAGATTATAIAAGTTITVTWKTTRATFGGASTAGAPTTALPPTAPPPTAPPTTAAATRTTAPAPPGARLVVWPAGTDGFTVVIASLPTALGAGQATARALVAANRGLPQTGVLVSDTFASLHPGYLVIFSGIYATLDETSRAAAAAQRLYPGAYPRRISR